MSRGPLPTLAILVPALLVLALPPAPAAGATTVRGTARELLADLRTAPERSAGYRSEKFPHWRNADGDGCDTRAEVLIVESLREVRIGPDCRLTDGRWRSAYDGVVTTRASSLDIDHVVALREAWQSGARAWSVQRRQAFANDLDDPRTLRAVTASSNRSKGDREPPDWMPQRKRCRYLGWWVAVKVRWRLAVDRRERRFVRKRLAACPERVLRVTVA